MNRKLLYLLAVAEPESRPVNQADGIFLKEWNKLLIAYKKVDKQEFGEDLKANLDNLEWLKKQVLAHEQSIQTLLPLGTVIPFKFGRIFETEEKLVQQLSSNRDFWTKEIKRLKGKQEWSLKVIADTEALQNYLQASQGTLKKEAEEIAQSSAGKAFFLKKKQALKTKEILNKKMEEEGQALLEKLQSLTEDLHLKQAQGDHQNKLLLNAVLLLEKSTDFFEWTEKELETLLSHQAYRFLISGPWAAYHFLHSLPETSSHEGE